MYRIDRIHRCGDMLHIPIGAGNLVHRIAVPASSDVAEWADRTAALILLSGAINRVPCDYEPHELAGMLVRAVRDRA
jgi:hypothetical protein